MSLGVFIIAALATDLLANGGEAMLYLARKFVTLVDFIKFWR